jgi:predicted HicB family RNase H-like nuclease
MTDILQYKAYFAGIHLSAEDEVFFNKIIGINDSVTFAGSTAKEQKKAFHEAVDDNLETFQKVGKEASMFASHRSCIAGLPLFSCQEYVNKRICSICH